VLEAWTETVSDENSCTEVSYLAIDDGVRDRVWVFAVSIQQYTVGVPGTAVHALADPPPRAAGDPAAPGGRSGLTAG
jgi:hypothetical protein